MTPDLSAAIHAALTAHANLALAVHGSPNAPDLEQAIAEDLAACERMWAIVHGPKWVAA